MTPEQDAMLRAPFAPEQIGKLPKPTKKENAKGKCSECGGWHGLPAVHLDYVGHAAITDRLRQVDPTWTWEPMATDERGLPLRDADGGLWINLTVADVTRPGYGDETNGKGTKEIIGDALRNAAMRFGVGLDLWSKENLHGDDDDAHTASSSGANLNATGAAAPQRSVDAAPDPHGLEQSRGDAVQPGQVIVPFGKWKNKPVSEVPVSYWEWWLGEEGSKNPQVLSAVFEIHPHLAPKPETLDTDIPF